jgi:hypothetical protein
MGVTYFYEIQDNTFRIMSHCEFFSLLKVEIDGEQYYENQIQFQALHLLPYIQLSN